jgi:hypothetical protein
MWSLDHMATQAPASRSDEAARFLAASPCHDLHIPRYDVVVQLVRLIVVAIAGVAAAAGYIQEGRRLQIIKQMPGDKARDFYEGVRSRNERVMWLVAMLLAAGAVAAVVKELAFSPTLPSG